MKFLPASLLFKVTALLFMLYAPAGAYAAAPDVSLMGLDNKQHKLDEYIGKGKWVILNVWGTRCPPCIEEMPELQAFHDKRSAKDAMVVGLAIDFPSYGFAKKDEVKRFVDENFIDFPILLGDASVVPSFGAGSLRGTPTSFVYSPQGELVAVQLGAVTEKAITNFIDNYK